MIVNLQCGKCENVECPIETLAGNDLEGCSRKVDDKVGDTLYHYREELIPFGKMKNQEAVDREYNKIMNFLYEQIYTAPIVNKLDKEGKIDERKKGQDKIALFNLGVTPAPVYEDDRESDFAKKLASLF